jgi:hypothetical protein
MRDALTLGDYLIDAENKGFTQTERHDLINAWRKACEEFRREHPEVIDKPRDLLARFAYHDLMREYAGVAARNYIAATIDSWQKNQGDGNK